jgi:hypothetical protein
MRSRQSAKQPRPIWRLELRVFLIPHSASPRFLRCVDDQSRPSRQVAPFQV